MQSCSYYTLLYKLWNWANQLILKNFWVAQTSALCTSVRSLELNWIQANTVLFNISWVSRRSWSTSRPTCSFWWWRRPSTGRPFRCSSLRPSCCSVRFVWSYVHYCNYVYVVLPSHYPLLVDGFDWLYCVLSCAIKNLNKIITKIQVSRTQGCRVRSNWATSELSSPFYASALSPCFVSRSQKAKKRL